MKRRESSPPHSQAESTQLEAKGAKLDVTVITEMEDDTERQKESLESINCLLCEESDDA